MPAANPQILSVGKGQDARQIAYRTTGPLENGATGVFWLSGFMSDMASTKATALAAWGAERRIAATFFDYSGHGQSSGPFTDGTIGRWLEEAEAVFSEIARGPQVIVGSSMGGYIALLLARKLAAEKTKAAATAKALVLIAPAWNMTEDLMWKRFSPAIRDELQTKGRYDQPSNYGAPYPITYSLIEDGRQHLLPDKVFDPGCPVTILQGRLDPDVPVEHVRRLAKNLPSETTNLIEIPDGDHRLSRPEDIARLFDEIAKNF